MAIKIIFIFFILFIIFWLISHIYSSIFYVPYVNADRSAIKDALKLGELKKGQLFLDLGCGRGDALIIASKEFSAKAIGYEISPLPYLLSKIRFFLIKDKSNNVYRKDFRKAKNEIRKADLIYLYLFEKVLEKNEQFLFDNLSAKGKIVTLAFKFPNKKPAKVKTTINLGIKTKIYLYLNEGLDKM